ncbi:MAG: SCO family protein [Proteobacteria bacterium]|nr:SCO family protein [Pseudomonadota bacterium]MDA1311520.1 SCO family protein [Pseudomonadota bacterium]
MTNRTFVILFSLLTVIFLGAVGAGVWIVSQSRQADSEGSSLVGGPFQLTDHTGRSVTEADYDDVHKIVYFGYTTCPDVCPTGLSVISEALEQLGPAAKFVKPLFITVDPERDTIAIMADYHQHFHPSFSNLTGTPEQIAAVAKAYRVFYQKADVDGSDDYLMDHSVITYLMAPGGGFLAHFGPETSPKQLADALRALR